MPLQARSALLTPAAGGVRRYPDDEVPSPPLGDMIVGVQPYADPGAGLTILPAQYYLLLPSPSLSSSILTAAPVTSVVYVDSAAGSLIFGGSGTEAPVVTPFTLPQGSWMPLGPQAASLIARPAPAASVVYVDANAGTLLFVGSHVEQIVFSQAAAGVLIFGGMVVESNSHPPVILPSPRSTQTFTAPD